VKKLELLKKAVSLIVGLGTAKIVQELIENNVDTESATSKVTVTVASYAIGGAVSEMASKYTDHLIDETVEIISKFKNNRKNNSEIQPMDIEEN